MTSAPEQADEPDERLALRQGEAHGENRWLARPRLVATAVRTGARTLSAVLGGYSSGLFSMLTRTLRAVLAASPIMLTCGILACGGSGYAKPTPVPTPAPQSFAELSGPVSAHSWVCTVGFRSGAGAISVRVSPPSYYLQLRGGSCGSPLAVLAESNTGALIYAAMPGEYHVMVGNPTDADDRFSVHADFFLP